MFDLNSSVTRILNRGVGNESRTERNLSRDHIDSHISTCLIKSGIYSSTNFDREGVSKLLADDICYVQGKAGFNLAYRYNISYNLKYFSRSEVQELRSFLESMEPEQQFTLATASLSDEVKVKLALMVEKITHGQNLQSGGVSTNSPLEFAARYVVDNKGSSERRLVIDSLKGTPVRTSDMLLCLRYKNETELWQIWQANYRNYNPSTGSMEYRINHEYLNFSNSERRTLRRCFIKLQELSSSGLQGEDLKLKISEEINSLSMNIRAKLIITGKMRYGESKADIFRYYRLIEGITNSSQT